MAEQAPRHVAVIDIGKANAKVVLVELETETEVAARRTPNTVLRSGPYPHHDIEHLWDFMLQSLAELQRAAAIEAIVVTTHGASAALVDAGGGLALPVLDYEHAGPDETGATYNAIRPDFEESGSPRLPGGLNLGAQLFWQRERFRKEFGRTAAILTYPQYWAMRLSGGRATELTSLGCHTDLWAPFRRDYSGMVDALGWRHLFPPIRRAADVLGPILPEIAAATGIAPGTPVHAGIHDSNASLYPHLLSRTPPFSVVSTGTWAVCLSVGGRRVSLDPARDTLVNVSALGEAVPSARFMGGREYEILAAGLPGPTEFDIDRVLGQGCMYLPAAMPGCGPFPRARGLWTGEPQSPGERQAAVSFYLAMMTATCLELCGAEGPIIVEGPFAANPAYTSMLRAAIGRPVLSETQGTGTSIGAALLTGTRLAAPVDRVVAEPGRLWSSYAQLWRNAVGGRG